MKPKTKATAPSPLSIVLLLLLSHWGPACGELQGVVGGKSDDFASWASLGFHMQPQLSDVEDFSRVSRIGRWVVLNVPLQFWTGPENARVRQAIDACGQYQLSCIVRLEDHNIVAKVAPDKGRATDAAWLIQDFEPYIKQVVEYGRDKVWGYQILNEPWYPSWRVLGPAGAVIQPAEYVKLLAHLRLVIQAQDPAAKVLMAGLQAVTTSDSATRARSLIDLGVLDHSDLFNFHYYSDGSFSEPELKRVKEIAGLVGDRPAIITECNHLDEHSDDNSKYLAIGDIWRHSSARFHNLVAQMAFVWRSNDGYQIGDTALEQLMGEHSAPAVP